MEIQEQKKRRKEKREGRTWVVMKVEGEAEGEEGARIVHAGTEEEEEETGRED